MRLTPDITTVLEENLPREVKSCYPPLIRNEALHGRFLSGTFFSPYAVYLWWAHLRLLMLPLINRFDEVRVEADAEDAPRIGPSTVGEA